MYVYIRHLIVIWKDIDEAYRRVSSPLDVIKMEQSKRKTTKRKRLLGNIAILIT